MKQEMNFMSVKKERTLRLVQPVPKGSKNKDVLIGNKAFELSEKRTAQYKDLLKRKEFDHIQKMIEKNPQEELFYLIKLRGAEEILELSLELSEFLGDNFYKKHKSELIKVMVAAIKNDDEDLKIGVCKILMNVRGSNAFEEKQMVYIFTEIEKMLDATERQKYYALWIFTPIINRLEYYPDCIDKFIDLLKEENEDIKIGAAGVLFHLTLSYGPFGGPGQDISKAFPELIKLLEHDEETTQQIAALAIGSMPEFGTSINEAFPRLLQILKTGGEYAKEAAFGAFVAAAENSEDVTDCLLDLLDFVVTELRDPQVNSDLTYYVKEIVKVCIENKVPLPIKKLRSKIPSLSRENEEVQQFALELNKMLWSYKKEKE